MAIIRQAIVEESAVSIVLSAMVVHTYCQPVVEEAVAFVRNLAAGNDKCRSAIVEANGVRDLIKAIKLHGTSEAIAELGCLALRNLSSGTTEHLAGVMAVGGIEFIVSSLRRHTCSSTVVYAGLAALRNLAVDAWENDRNPQPVRSLSAIIDADGISAIVEVMGAHINNADVWPRVGSAAAHVERGARSRHGCNESAPHARRDPAAGVGVFGKSDPCA